MIRPILDRAAAVAIAIAAGVHDEIFLLGLRGFMAPADKNKRGIYDDAIFLVTPTECVGYNANTDPSINRKGIAVLQPGVYKYKQGLHGIHHLDLSKAGDKAIYDQLLSTRKNYPAIAGRILPYWAFRQAGPVTILRDGATATETKTDPASWPWIDIHRGGYNTTSSEGCQTIHPDQWPEAKAKGYAAMDAADLKSINYVLSNK